MYYQQLVRPNEAAKKSKFVQAIGLRVCNQGLGSEIKIIILFMFFPSCIYLLLHKISSLPTVCVMTISTVPPTPESRRFLIEVWLPLLSNNSRLESSDRFEIKL